jgi:predicted heme/steroid binding protein
MNRYTAADRSYKLTAVSSFRSTRGMGMKKPMKATLAALLLAGTPTLAACGQDGAQTSVPASSDNTISTIVTNLTADGATNTTGNQLTSTWQRFTLEELARYDGKEGRPAYVAVDGNVYDVSDSSKWPEGTHSPCNLGAMAGQDLSTLITKAPPQMPGLLAQMPVVGTLQ